MSDNYFENDGIIAEYSGEIYGCVSCILCVAVLVLLRICKVI